MLHTPFASLRSGTSTCEVSCQDKYNDGTLRNAFNPWVVEFGLGGVGSCINLPSSIILAHMSKSRLEAFSDGVIAILITIMVLELRVPRGTDWSALRELVPVFLSYVLSFVFLGIYWNNHHHLLQAAKRVNGLVLWANLYLL
ncbi:MAG TPA: TMEM175 family protein, partial [Anaerolineales bacterium]|nr:TMEM175 family protein [Anaerolineales bacterium]